MTAPVSRMNHRRVPRASFCFRSFASHVLTLVAAAATVACAGKTQVVPTDAGLDGRQDASGPNLSVDGECDLNLPFKSISSDLGVRSETPGVVFQSPVLTADELLVLYVSLSLADSGRDVFSASRTSRNERFSDPRPVGGLGDYEPDSLSLSGDGLVLNFTHKFELYRAVRPRLDAEFVVKRAMPLGEQALFARVSRNELFVAYNDWNLGATFWRERGSTADPWGPRIILRGSTSAAGAIADDGTSLLLLRMVEFKFQIVEMFKSEGAEFGENVRIVSPLDIPLTPTWMSPNRCRIYLALESTVGMGERHR